MHSVFSKFFGRPGVVKVLLPSLWVQIAGISLISVIDAPFRADAVTRRQDRLQVRFSGSNRVESARLATVQTPSEAPAELDREETMVELPEASPLGLVGDRAMAEVNQAATSSVALSKRTVPLDLLQKLAAAPAAPLPHVEPLANPRATPDQDMEAPDHETRAERPPRSRTSPQPEAPSTLVSIPQRAGTDRRDPPSFANNRPPAYPVSAYRAGIEGEVLLRVHVSRTGRVERVEISRSSGYAILDEAAREAVESWQGTPATRQGRRVATVELLPVHFRLRQ